MSRHQDLEDYARKHGLGIATYSPGDGVRRYRFYMLKDARSGDYFGCKAIYTAMGIAEAGVYVHGVAHGVYLERYSSKEDACS